MGTSYNMGEVSSKVGTISSGVRRMISEQGMSIGDSLPAERELCSLFDASKMTVVRALERLERQGLISRKRGVGTQVLSLPGQSAGVVKLVLQAGASSTVDVMASLAANRKLAEKHNVTISSEVIPCENDTVTMLKEMYYRDPGNIAGFIYLPAGSVSTRDINERAVRWFMKEGLPFVLLGRIANSEITNNYLFMDDILGGRLAARTLIKGHYQKYVYVSHGRQLNVIDRREGFVDELRSRGVHENNIIQLKATRDPAGWRKVMTSLLRRKTLGKSVGYLTTSEELANVLLHCMREEGVTVPKDSGIVAFDSGTTIGAHLGISTLVQPVENMAGTALDMLMDQVSGSAPVIAPKAMPVHLIERETTGI